MRSGRGIRGMNWNVGDLVVLKSGGPVMRVIDIGERYVWCQWYDEDSGVQYGPFNPEVLAVSRLQAAACPTPTSQLPASAA
jgi:uncharacterized protein YodC (DUF2158 family)